MNKKVKFIGGLSRKTKINIFIAVFLIFILISIFTSINQFSNIVKNKEKIVELEQQLNWERQKNIELLAEEKSLYEEEAIEFEARKQFNMTKGEETNYFVEIEEESEEEPTKLKESSGYNQDSLTTSYREAGLWEKIKVFYNNEIK